MRCRDPRRMVHAGRFPREFPSRQISRRKLFRYAKLAAQWGPRRTYANHIVKVFFTNDRAKTRTQYAGQTTHPLVRHRATRAATCGIGIHRSTHA